MIATRAAASLARSRLRACAPWALVVALVHPAMATAQDGEDAEHGTSDAGSTAGGEARHHLEQGRRLYSDLDFLGAVDALREAIGVPGAPDPVRLRAYGLLGASYVVLERPAAAREAFTDMLRIDPYHVVREPSGSPKIRSFVERVRREQVPDAALDPAVRLRVDLPRGARADEPIRVVVRAVEGGDRVATVSVRYRGLGEQQWDQAEAQRTGERFVAELPARGSADELQLYAQARNTGGDVVARAAEPLSPLALAVRPPATTAPDSAPAPLWKKWWLWTAVGAAVVVAGIGLGVGLSDGGAQAPEGTLAPGRVQLP